MCFEDSPTRRRSEFVFRRYNRELVDCRTCRSWSWCGYSTARSILGRPDNLAVLWSWRGRRIYQMEMRGSSSTTKPPKPKPSRANETCVMRTLLHVRMVRMAINPHDL